MKLKIILFVLAAFFATFGGAQAQRSDSIAAVVNGDIITYTDLYDRMDLIIKSSRMPNTAEFKERLLPQILTGLITEAIQLQEANRLNLSVTDEEIETGFAELAGQNNIPPAQFKQALKQQNINLNTLYSQIESQLAWGKVIQQQIRPRVNLTDRDIDSEIERLKAKEGQSEYLLAEIFLPVDDTNTESEVRQAADDLSRQLSNDPSKFPAAARQFSQSATAANGGIIGWVTPDQLDTDIASALTSLSPNSLSGPVKGDGGYTILFLKDKRTINLTQGEQQSTLRIKAAVFDLPAEETRRKAVNDDVDVFVRDVKGCLDITKQIAKRNNAQLREYNDIAPAIPSDILKAVDTTNIGEVAQPIRSDNVIIVPMLCGRDGGGQNAILEREVENRIGTQRLDVLQKRYLRDLITEAYIERRV